MRDKEQKARDRDQERAAQSPRQTDQDKAQPHAIRALKQSCAAALATDSANPRGRCSRGHRR